ncbi:MAG: anaerobic ribonucleoside-triphosphate reductase activating protein [bacterium]
MQKFTTLDFPGFTGATLFTGGCNFRCKFCHNPELVIPEKLSFLTNDYIIDFLKSRKGLIEAVTICGGEPTIHKEVLDWIKFIKELGFKVKLDTNATNSVLLEKVISENLVDMFAIDYKAPKKNFKDIVGTGLSPEMILDNISKVVSSGISYEIRTTIHNDLHSEADIFEMIRELKEIGVDVYYLQAFKKTKETVGEVSGGIGSAELVRSFKEELKNHFNVSGVRNVD